MGKPDPNTDIESLKAKRTKDRSKATKQINELKSLFKQVHEDNQSPARYELDYAIEIGESHLTLLGTLEAQLRDAGIEDAESTHIADLHRAIGLGKRLLAGLRELDVHKGSVVFVFGLKFE